MDLSKLPKMSRTPEQPKPATPEASPDVPVADAAPAERRADAPVAYIDPGPSGWISLIVGALVALFYPRLWQYLAHVMFGSAFTWTFTDAAGNPLPYTQTVYFLGDLAVGLFAVAMVIEGVVLLAFRRRGFIAFALGLAALATLANVLFVVFMLASGYGLQFVSLIAVIVGGWMCFSLWDTLKRPQGRRYVLVPAD